jgi:hypothetical protein
MKKDNFWNKCGEAGQTSVEYIMMIFVVVTVATAVFEKLEGYILTNPNSIKNQYLGTYKNMFSGSNGSFNGQYKWFTVKK